MSSPQGMERSGVGVDENQDHAASGPRVAQDRGRTGARTTPSQPSGRATKPPNLQASDARGSSGSTCPRRSEAARRPTELALVARRHAAQGAPLLLCGSARLRARVLTVRQRAQKRAWLPGSAAGPAQGGVAIRATPARTRTGCRPGARAGTMACCAARSTTSPASTMGRGGGPPTR